MAPRYNEERNTERKIVVQNSGQVVKYVFLILLLGAIIYAFFAKPWTCSDDPPVPDPYLAPVLIDSGFVPADVIKDPQEGGDKTPDGATTTASGTGTIEVQEEWTPGDSLEVHWEVAEDPSGYPWVGLWIEGQPVQWTEYPIIHMQEERIRKSPWTGFFAAQVTPDSLVYGMGLSYTIWEPIEDLRIGLATVVDVEHGFEPQWVTPALRAEAQLWIFRASIYGGYTLGQIEGWTGGAALGWGFDW